MSIQKYCDKIAVLRRGRIVDAGYTNNIINKPKDGYVRALTKTQINMPNRN